MKLMLSICLAAAVAVVALPVYGAGGAPSAVWPDLRYAFDPVVEGSSVRHDIVVRNRGEADLQIHRVETG